MWSASDWSSPLARKPATGFTAPRELQRLLTLRELLERHDIGLADLGFAARISREPALRESVEEWLRSQPHRPEDVPDSDWLAWEQERHRRLLAAVAERGTDTTTPTTRNA